MTPDPSTTTPDASYRVVRSGDPGLGQIVPVEALAVEALGEPIPDPAWPEELEVLGPRAVERRRGDFLRGRTCARRALTELGVAPVAIVAGADRAPIWPTGIAGSITHTHAYCCAVVTRHTAWRSIGIDAEQLRHLERGVEDKILLAAERARLADRDPAIAWSCVVFSIKEALYKAWHPLTARWLDFHEADVVLEAADRFTVTVLAPDPSVPRVLTGRYAIVGAHVLACLAIA